MKKVFILIVSFLLISTTIFAQTEKGKWELSISGWGGSYKAESSYKTSNFSYKSEVKGEGAALLLRSGYFLYNNFEIEPELQMTFAKYVQPSYSFNGNLSYNITFFSKKYVPFVLVGLGLANSFPRAPYISIPESDRINLLLLNLGIGTKLFMDDNIAIRLEYRYISNTHEITETDLFGNKFNTDKTSESNTFLIGFSYFL